MVYGVGRCFTRFVNHPLGRVEEGICGQVSHYLDQLPPGVGGPLDRHAAGKLSSLLILLQIIQMNTD